MITIEDIKEIDNIDFFTFHDSIYLPGKLHVEWREIDYPESDHIYYQDLNPIKPGEIKETIKERDIFLIPNYMQYGDYDNSCMVERSNYKLFLENYKEEKGIFTISGGYGSSGVAISLNYLLNPDNEDKAQNIIDLLNSLNDYPCIDDEDMSNMEYDLFLESLDSFEIRDCNDLLSKQFLLEVYDFNEDKLKEILLESDRNLNYPAYEIESGGSCYIDTKRLIEKVTLNQYTGALIDFELKG
jgi:hypothetical protein